MVPPGAIHYDRARPDDTTTELHSAGASEGPAQPHAEQSPNVEPSAPSRRRVWAVRGLIWVTTVLAVLAILAVWANRQLLNPNNWANTSGQFGKITSAQPARVIQLGAKFGF